MSPNIQYEFQDLERISRDVEKFVKNKWPGGYGLVDDYRAYLKRKAEQIKDRLATSALIYDKQKLLRRYIQFHQRALIRILTNIARHIPEDGTKANASLVLNVYESLQELLRFIEQQYGDYFDANAWIPSDYQQVAMEEIHTGLEDLKSQLLIRGANKQLVDISINPLERFTNQSEIVEITYRYVTYLRELKKQLYLVLNNKSIEINEQLRSMLFYLNFNSIDFYEYSKQGLVSICNDADCIEDCIENLSFFSKILSQTMTKPNTVFDPKLPGIKEQLTLWIEAEINFQKLRQQLKNQEESETSESGAQHIETTMSVAQLAYFTRILVETKTIRHKFATRTFKVIAKTFRTDRTDQVSQNSFKNAYYDPEPGTRDSIRTMIQSMLTYIDKDKEKE